MEPSFENQHRCVLKVHKRCAQFSLPHSGCVIMHVQVERVQKSRLVWFVETPT